MDQSKVWMDHGYGAVGPVVKDIREEETCVDLCQSSRLTHVETGASANEAVYWK